MITFTRPKRAVEVEAALKEVTGSEVHVDYKDGKGSLKIDLFTAMICCKSS